MLAEFPDFVNTMHEFDKWELTEHNLFRILIGKLSWDSGKECDEREDKATHVHMGRLGRGSRGAFISQRRGSHMPGHFRCNDPHFFKSQGFKHRHRPGLVLISFL